MSTVTIRSATERDLAALSRLYIDFHEFHVRGVPDRLRSLGTPDQYDFSELSASLTKIIGADDSTVFVAETADQLIGLTEVYLRVDDKTNKYIVPRTYGFVQSLMVNAAYRHHGLGTALLKTAQQWAKDKGATELKLDMWEFDAGPLHFYEKCGYRTLKRTLVKEI